MLPLAVVMATACCLLATSVGCQVSVMPGGATVPVNGSTWMSCVFPTPLSDCRGRVFLEGLVDAELPLRRGAAAPATPVTYLGMGWTRMTATYHGDGLPRGSCGMRLDGVQSGDYILQCRGRSVDGGWSQGVSSLITSTHELLASTSPTPRLITARPGDNVTVLLRTTAPLDDCSIKTPLGGFLAYTAGMTPPVGRQFELEAGEGLEHGECGFRVVDVGADDAGVWEWWGWHGRRLATQNVVVLVAAAPSGEPVLRVRNASRLRAGDVLEATCAAPPAVPPPTLRWLLGGRTLRADAWNDTRTVTEGGHEVAVDWSLPWQPQPATQTLRRRLTERDVGQTLECRMEHLMLDGHRTASVALTPDTPSEGSANVLTPDIPS